MNTSNIFEYVEEYFISQLFQTHLFHLQLQVYTQDEDFGHRIPQDPAGRIPESRRIP